jgi:hypothetical protein
MLLAFECPLAEGISPVLHNSLLKSNYSNIKLRLVLFILFSESIEYLDSLLTTNNVIALMIPKIVIFVNLMKLGVNS